MEGESRTNAKQHWTNNHNSKIPSYLLALFNKIHGSFYLFLSVKKPLEGSETSHLPILFDWVALRSARSWQFIHHWGFKYGSIMSLEREQKPKRILWDFLPTQSPFLTAHLFNLSRPYNQKWSHVKPDMLSHVWVYLWTKETVSCSTPPWKLLISTENWCLEDECSY